VIVLGGTHDLTLGQYHAFRQDGKSITASVVDACIDLELDSDFPADHFLLEMLTAEPNYIKHYNHIAFQSYFVHPRMLETLDKLRFDCIRLGHVREAIEETEPVLRQSHFLSFDISAIAHAFAPANRKTTNGLQGDEACTIIRYAGMSPELRTVGIYGYDPDKDPDLLTARQIAQMIWYYFDGYAKGKREAPLAHKDAFNEFHLSFAEVEAQFLQSKKTGRWWMQLPDERYIACSYGDYVCASNNQIPERWFRAQERES
jgi:formiminoglutamase